MDLSTHNRLYNEGKTYDTCMNPVVVNNIIV